MMKIVFLNDKYRKCYIKIISPAGRLLGKFGISPNVISILGFVLSLFAGLIYSAGSFFWAAWIVVLAGCCDTLDGVVARSSSKETSFGAFLDSVLDRYSDTFILIGLAWFFSGGPSLWRIQSTNVSSIQSPVTVFFIIMAIIGSFMVSYTRARAEGLGINCKIGLMQRSERMVLLIIGSLLGSIPLIGLFLMKATLLTLAVSTNITAIQRMRYVRHQLLQEKQAQ
jgi:CDP-diacylglycerol--glycerol-3-phosphate 3-phosphatidyltransferase